MRVLTCMHECTWTYILQCTYREQKTACRSLPFLVWITKVQLRLSSYAASTWPTEQPHWIMHWCAPWCWRRAISPSGFFLELGFTSFFPMEVHATASHPCWHLCTLHLSGTVGLGRQTKITVCRESHHKATMPAQSLQFADSSVLAVQTSDTEHDVALFKK